MIYKTVISCNTLLNHLNWLCRLCDEIIWSYHWCYHSYPSCRHTLVSQKLRKQFLTTSIVQMLLKYYFWEGQQVCAWFCKNSCYLICVWCIKMLFTFGFVYRLLMSCQTHTKNCYQVNFLKYWKFIFIFGPAR